MELIPLSETFTNSFGINDANCLLKSRLTSNVFRFLLLTPIIFRLGIIDFSSSS